jgi:hypothetical protein
MEKLLDVGTKKAPKPELAWGRKRERRCELAGAS